VMRRRLRTGCFTLVIGVALALALGSWYDRPPAPVGTWLKTAGLEPHFETIDGVRVRYVRAGSGRGSPVVLLHGFGSSIYTWKDVLPALARDHDVAAFDFPGFGESDQPPDLSFERYPRLVIALMDRLGFAKACLVGNSMGGAVGVLVAATFPERVSALALIDSAGFNLAPGDRPALVRLVTSSAAGAIVGGLPVRRLLVEVALRQVFAGDALVTDERVAEYLAPLRRPGALASIRSLSASRGLAPNAVRDALPRVPAPVLIVWGREDRWIPVSNADLFAAALPGARKAILDACGHLPQEERPADLLRCLRELLPPGAPENPE
jgi:pimeloyl-ACP methyl ester carboxylesterase